MCQHVRHEGDSAFATHGRSGSAAIPRIRRHLGSRPPQFRPLISSVALVALHEQVHGGEELGEPLAAVLAGLWCEMDPTVPISGCWSSSHFTPATKQGSGSRLHAPAICPIEPLELKNSAIDRGSTATAAGIQLSPASAYPWRSITGAPFPVHGMAALVSTGALLWRLLRVAVRRCRPEEGRHRSHIY